MTKFSNKLKKPSFCPIFPIFWAKKIFPKNPALSSTTSHGILASCQNLEKLMTQFQENTWTDRTEGQTEGWKEGQNLFYRSLPATTGGPKSIK